MKKLVMVGMIGMVMLAGSIVRGADPVVTVGIAIPKVNKDGNYYVKVNGAIGGSHSCSDSTYTAKGVKMKGPGAGDVMLGVQNTWIGNAGEKPSQTVNDTRVVVTYSKKKEPKITGSAELTVVGVKGKMTGVPVFPGLIVDVVVKAKGSPKALTFGTVTLTFSNPLKINDPNPYTIKMAKGRSVINFSHRFSSNTKFMGTSIILSCPFGPILGKLPFGCKGVFIKNGMGVVIKLGIYF